MLLRLFLCLSVFTLSLSTYGNSNSVDDRLNIINNPHHLSASIDSQYFIFREFSTIGTVLDKEEGWLNGVSLLYQYQATTAHTFKINTSYLTGTVAYDGHTQGGVSHRTDTKQGLLGVDAAYFYQFKRVPNYRIGFQYGVFEWDRRIQPKGNILGLDEIYSWISVGILQSYKVKNLKFELALLSLRQGKMDVNLIEVVGRKVQVPLKTGNQVDFSARYEYSLSSGLKSYIEVTSKWRYFIASDAVRIGSSSILEPENELFQYGLNFGVKLNF